MIKYMEAMNFYRENYFREIEHYISEPNLENAARSDFFILALNMLRTCRDAIDFSSCDISEQKIVERILSNNICSLSEDRRHLYKEVKGVWQDLDFVEDKE